MKQFNMALLTLILVAGFFACHKNNASSAPVGTWVSRAYLGSIPAFGAAASFTVNNAAYMGTGLDPLTPGVKQTALFKYTPGALSAIPTGLDSAVGTWTQVQSFPGQARSNAVGFSIGNTGYIGSGLANDGRTALADFYAYNPSANNWSPVASIQDSSGSYPRFGAVAFSFDTTAYVLTGTDGKYYFGDAWRYSPTTNKWVQQNSYPGTQRSGAISFVYNDQGYLVTGYTPGSRWAQGNLAYDFWRFTPGSDTSTTAWARLSDIYHTNSAGFDNGYTSIIRQNGCGFLVLGQPEGDKAYITLGAVNGTDITSTWEYDFASDRWTPRLSFAGSPRQSATGFTLSGTVPSSHGAATTRGFVAAGLNEGNAFAYSDCYEFFPNQATARQKN
jgi:N-acetylneuraminic acid mutarotase